jgi:DNA-binding MarR family transcriptional regulator
VEVLVPDSPQSLALMAQEIFELYRLVALARSRQPATADDLSETEFLTLDALVKEQPLSVGEIQKRIGVVAAQMSRIIRALEVQGGKGFVSGTINKVDRRRINVSLSDAGRKAHQEYQERHLKSMVDVLSVLSPTDRTNFMRILGQIRGAFQIAF